MTHAASPRPCADLLVEARRTGSIVDAQGTPRPLNSEIS